jgi:hypothetical protein
MITGTRPVTIVRNTTAEAVAALAATYPADGVGGAAAGVAAGRYPAALRAQAAAVSAGIGDDARAARLAADIHRAGLGRVLSALVVRDLAGRPGDAVAQRVLDDVEAAVPSAAAPTDPGGDERIRRMHADSRYGEAPGLGELPGIRVWPVRLLTPAPAGKLFAKGIPPGEDLRLVFGDSGQVGVEAGVDWPQWYRLGVWHAILAARWAAPVGAVAADPAGRAGLDEAFARIPAHALRKVGVHEATVSRFDGWRAYFTDAMISAGKVVLETAVAGSASGADQARWLRSLGRVHLDWFVAQLAATGVDGVSPARLAQDWLADAAALAELEPVFAGPLAACENPLWATGAQVAFSPSVDRLTRRTLAAWLRTHWPGRVETLEVADPAGLASPGATRAPRLVFALAADEDWVAAVEGTLAPESRAWWRAGVGAAPRPAATPGLAAAPEPGAVAPGPGAVGAGPGAAWACGAGRGVLFAARGPGTLPWSRVSVAPDADGLVRLQQVRRPFADWTALGAGPTPPSGRLHYTDDGLPALEPPDAGVTD